MINKTGQLEINGHVVKFARITLRNVSDVRRMANRRMIERKPAPPATGARTGVVVTNPNDRAFRQEMKAWDAEYRIIPEVIELEAALMHGLHVLGEAPHEDDWLPDAMDRVRQRGESRLYPSSSCYRFPDPVLVWVIFKRYEVLRTAEDFDRFSAFALPTGKFSESFDGLEPFKGNLIF